MGRSITNELLDKSKEAMVSAVQIYNNPLIKFKSEMFIITAIISWTYLMHAYYSKKSIDYRYFHMKGKRKRYDRTKNGAYKHWELERCINEQASPLDKGTANNLRFLIGIRHEIEHQKTDSIDEYIGAKLQACALNYNREIIKMFGDKHSIKDNLSLAIQFSPISPEQEQLLRKESTNEIPTNVRNFIATFESKLDDEELKSLYYSYRIVYIPIQVNRANQADKAIEFISPDSDKAKDVERVLVKAVEKAKFLPGDIVKMMNEEGYSTFSMHYVVKPFSPSELVARVKAHIARYQRLKGDAQKEITVLRFGTLEIQPQTHRVFVSGREVHLATREFELLLFLAQHPQIVFSKDTLYDRIWNLDAMGNTSTVSVHINRLREKIEADPANPHWLQTVWGVGYRFNSSLDSV